MHPFLNLCLEGCVVSKIKRRHFLYFKKETSVLKATTLLIRMRNNFTVCIFVKQIYKNLHLIQLVSSYKPNQLATLYTWCIAQLWSHRSWIGARFQFPSKIKQFQKRTMQHLVSCKTPRGPYQLKSCFWTSASWSASMFLILSVGFGMWNQTNRSSFSLAISAPLAWGSNLSLGPE